jgi:hypothetical protein
MPFTDADLDAMLEATGELVTLGATSVYGVIRAVDPQQFRDSERAVAITTKALSVAVRTGALLGLASGVTVVIRGTQHVVDQILSITDGGLTLFLAWPSPDPALAFSDTLTLSDART